MFITKRKIISLLKDNEKNNSNILLKNKKKVIKVLNDMYLSDLVQLLFNKNLDTDLKFIIKDVIESTNRIYLSSDIRTFLNTMNIEEADLFKEYYPNILKKYIVNILYGDNIIDKVFTTNNNPNLQMKVVDVFDGYYLAQLLRLELDDTVIDYIFKNKFYDVENIIEVLRDYKVSIELKHRIINEYVNKDNIIEILGNVFSKELIDIFVYNKNDELIEGIKVLNEAEIISFISKYKFTDEVYNYFFKYKEDELIKILGEMDSDKLVNILIKAKNSKVVELIMDRYAKRIKNELKCSNEKQLLDLFYNDYIPEEIKTFVLENNEDNIKKEIKNKRVITLRSSYLRKDNNIPDLLKKYIVEIKYDELLESLNDKTPHNIVLDIAYGNYCDDYIKLLIKNRVCEENIIELINKVDRNIITFIFELCGETLKNVVEKLEIQNLVKMYGFSDEEVKKQVIYITSDIIKKKVEQMPKNERYSILCNTDALKEIKIIVLESIGIKSDDLDVCVELIKYNDIEKVLDNYKTVKKFFENSPVDMYAFIQYGSGSDINDKWLDQIIDIMNKDKKDNFFKVLNYLNRNLYAEDLEKENPVSNITNFLRVLNGYTYNFELLEKLSQENISLSSDEMDNLKYLFTTNISVSDFENISNIRKEIFKEYEDIINNSDDIKELKKIFLKFLLGDDNKTLKSIGGSEGIIKLKNANKDVLSIQNMADEVLKYTTLIEKITYTNNIEGLRKILKYFINNKDNLIRVQNVFKNFDDLVRKLFETEIQVNLSKVDDAYKLNLVDEYYSEQYGGIVLDYRNTDYCLLAHTVSRYEIEDELINGISSSNRNFISMSPISYLGQKYYFDREGLIFAYDHIPKGSFVCSSVRNMSTNYWVKNNSAQTDIPKKEERGILETSAVVNRNAEVLLYRENVKPCGIVLPGGRKPSEREMEIHKKYNLPFILTQNSKQTIEDPKISFKKHDVSVNYEVMPEYINKVISCIDASIPYIHKTNEYTGRVIALIADGHSMYEPTLAVLEDIKKQGIDEIYSLGDNIGEGPNPHETLNLLLSRNVISVAGNSEYYSTLGTGPFSYFSKEKSDNQEWTYDKLDMSDLRYLESMKPSIDLSIGDKKIALCHFGNDIRWDYLGKNSTWSYQRDFVKGENAKQFLHTNSDEALEKIKNHLEIIDKNIGYIDAYRNPIFNGKKITEYDNIFQGHVHFDMNDSLKNTNINTLRALAMGYSLEDDRRACYYILKEKNDGTFDIEKKLVPFNNNLLISKIESSGIPHKETILKYTRAR